MVAGMIVVSGKTSFSKGFRPFMQIGNMSAVRRMVVVMQEAGADRVFLVTSEDVAELEKHVARLGVVCVRNGDSDAEMIDNIRFGLETLPEKFRKVVVAPANSPMFSIDTVKALIDSSGKAAVPVYGGRQGHPAMISRGWFRHILEAPPRSGLREIFSAREAEVAKIAVRDRGTLYNTRSDDADWDELAAEHTLNRLRPAVRVSIARDDVFYGPGTQILLELIDETKSVRAACERVGISYSKGWKMIAHLEKQVGFEIMVRQQGGEKGGASSLTEAGKAFVDSYRRYSAEVARKAKEMFGKYFGRDSKE